MNNSRSFDPCRIFLSHYTIYQGSNSSCCRSPLLPPGPDMTPPPTTTTTTTTTTPTTTTTTTTIPVRPNGCVGRRKVYNGCKPNLQPSRGRYEASEEMTQRRHTLPAHRNPVTLKHAHAPRPPVLAFLTAPVRSDTATAISDPITCTTSISDTRS